MSYNANLTSGNIRDKVNIGGVVGSLQEVKIHTGTIPEMQINREQTTTRSLGAPFVPKIVLTKHISDNSYNIAVRSIPLEINRGTYYQSSGGSSGKTRRYSVSILDDLNTIQFTNDSSDSTIYTYPCEYVLIGW